MSTDVLPGTQGHSQPPRLQQRSDHRDSSPGRWWKRSLLAIGVVAAAMSATALIPGAISPREICPRLTYTITRGDLIVTVTEKGSLESSENTEIKCKVRGARIPINWLIKNGTEVKPGDELVRLGMLVFEDRHSEMLKWAHVTRALAERSKADVAVAELAIPEYLEGRYGSELMILEKDLAIAESAFGAARSMLGYTKMLAERGYSSELDVEEATLAVTQAELNVEVKKTQIDVLRDFTKAMELETLNGNLKATKASHQANMVRAKQTADQLALCSKDVEYCVVKAESSGLVIYPTTEPWKYSPEIKVGATVYMGQTLLLMPDLSKMQVKINIPESKINRIKPGLAVRITLADKTLDGEVASVASVTAPTSRWTGNVVTYDTIIKLSSAKGLKPGGSAGVEVIVDRHENVLTIPVAAVVETAEGAFCWVKAGAGVRRHSLQLGDTNDEFTVVTAGLQEGDEVVLNSLAFIEDAKVDVVKP